MVRADLVNQLILHEGFRLKPYVDTVGKVTVGIGHNLTDKGLTSGQVLDILNTDIDDTFAFLDKECPWWRTLSETRQLVLADMAFVMMKKLLDFKGMIAAIKAGDFERAADSILNSKFGQQTGTRAITLSRMMRIG